MTAGGRMPPADNSTRKQSEQDENRDSERTRQDDRRDQLRAPETGTVDVDLGTNADHATLTKIKITHNGTNHRQSGRRAETDEDVGEGRGKL